MSSSTYASASQFSTLNNNNINKNEQQINIQQHDPFDTGVKIRCACEPNTNQQKWKTVTLTTQQYNNILSVIGLPPKQILLYIPAR